MRRVLPILALSLLVGCASKPKKAVAPVVVYEDRPAAALAYAAPVGSLIPDEVLDRDLRAPRAFMGYTPGYTEFYWVRTDDRFRFGEGHADRYERRAVSTRVGIIER